MRAVVPLLAVAAWLAAGNALAAPLATATPLTVEQPGRDAGDIITTDRALARRASPPAPAPAANPLWAIPLSTLTQTRERPLFSPSRRPPPEVADGPHTPPRRLPPRPRPPDRPHLTLIGTIAGASEGFGLFLDPTTKAVVRLKTGKAYQGWTLRAVHERDVVLEKNHLNETLSLPTHALQTPPAPPHRAPPRRARRQPGPRHDDGVVGFDSSLIRH